MSAPIAIIGLGYVGLPVALAFARKTKVIGFDINAERVALMQQGIDPSKELHAEDFKNCDIIFTCKIEDLVKATFFIVAVPTPIDEHNKPNLKPLLSATETVAKALKKGDTVVFESTVYPGCTEEDCVPILERISGLTYITDFKVGYSPERINPGDKEHTITKITKVVSGCDAETLEKVANTYLMIVEAGVHRATSIKVAEAAKIIENTQRDVNIALMNELSMIFNKMNINTYDVLAAAGTKWNFLKFSPGLAGGHCIGVDSYYLTYKAETLGHHAKVILSGRETNDGMGAYIARNTIQLMIKQGVNIANSRVLVMGATFKENVSDIRNSKVADIIAELKQYSVNVHITDAHANSEELMHEYGFGLDTAYKSHKYDAIILAVNHYEYKELVLELISNSTNKNVILIDVKGALRLHKFVDSDKYWSL